MKRFCLMLLLMALLPQLSAAQPGPPRHLLIRFVHEANGKPLQRDSTYINAFGEHYQVSKLRYYIGNLNLNCQLQKANYHLIDAFGADSFFVNMQATVYTSLCFTMGVDSLRQTMGVQGGALDPLNDMFWTWNTGYVTLKLDGTSPESTADLNRIEQHIGGYRPPFTAIRPVELLLPADALSHGTLTIHVNLDAYWNAVHENRISEQAVITKPGQQAANVANNFSAMFSIK